MLYEPYSIPWLLSYTFYFSFYLVSPLMAFNTFASLAIDVYTKLMEQSLETPEATIVEKHLEAIQGEMSERGEILHISMSADLEKAKILEQLYAEEVEDDDDDTTVADSPSRANTKGSLAESPNRANAKESPIDELRKEVEPEDDVQELVAANGRADTRLPPLACDSRGSPDLKRQCETYEQ